MTTPRLIRTREIELGRVDLDTNLVPQLLDRLQNHHDLEERNYAAELLGRIGDSRAVEPLIDILTDRSDMVNYNAAEALSKIGEAAVLPLINALKNEDRSVRSKSAQILSKIKDIRALEPCIMALNDEYSAVRFWAVLALGELGDSRALPELERVALQDRVELWKGGPKVSDAAFKAILQIKMR